MINLRRMRWTGHLACMGEKWNAYRIRRKWEDNIRVNLREIGWGGMDWIDLAQDREQ
jgi:hypothetical protein